MNGWGSDGCSSKTLVSSWWSNKVRHHQVVGGVVTAPAKAVSNHLDSSIFFSSVELLVGGAVVALLELAVHRWFVFLHYLGWMDLLVIVGSIAGIIGDSVGKRRQRDGWQFV